VNPRKLPRKALSSPANLRFEDARDFARAFGFHLSRVRGSHHIFDALLRVRRPAQACLAGQFRVVAAIPRLRDRRMAA